MEIDVVTLLAQYGLAGASIALFYLFAKDTVQKGFDSMKVALDNNTAALKAIEQVVARCKLVQEDGSK